MINTLFYRFLNCLLFFLIATTLQANDEDILNNKVNLSKNKGSIYQLLKEVSDQSGYLFIYDSQIINNDQSIKIRKGEYTLREAIYSITGRTDLQIDIIGNHILLRSSHKKELSSSLEEEKIPEEEYPTIRGVLYDQVSGNPIVFGSVNIVSTSIGTISNQNGEFQLVIPDSLIDSHVQFSHIGYESQQIESQFLVGENINFFLEPKIISLQEIVVQVIDPIQVLNNMLDQKENNYSLEPVYMTSFYREGIDHKNKNIDLTEAVLEVYKSGYQYKTDKEQAKLIKKRRIVSKQDNDTIFPRMKSGINSCFILDIMKDVPDFINPENKALYNYTHTGINFIDDRKVNIISFEQKEHIIEPLFQGKLFIEEESGALIEAQLEINPFFANKATNLFIDKKTRSLKIALEEAKYIVSYKLGNDSNYYINHVRGDIHFKVRKKRRLFSTPLHFWFEMVTCKIDTENVKRFSRNERLSLNKVFSETEYSHDKNFWNNFNIILPEEKLQQAIINNLNEVIINNYQ